MSRARKSAYQRVVAEVAGAHANPLVLCADAGHTLESVESFVAESFEVSFASLVLRADFSGGLLPLGMLEGSGEVVDFFATAFEFGDGEIPFAGWVDGDFHFR